MSNVDIEPKPLEPVKIDYQSTLKSPWLIEEIIQPLDLLNEKDPLIEQVFKFNIGYSTADQPIFGRSRLQSV
jgi:hypothetical protein